MTRWLALVFLILPPALYAQAAPRQANQYVGSAVCRTCHPDVAQNFYKNPHYKSVASGKEAPERTGCEGCHGPGGGHVAAGGGKNTIPHAFSLVAANQILDDCLTCHSKDLSKANIRR